MKFRAVIFDLDGVICFTDQYHYLAWKEMADGLGIYFDQEINDRLRGVSRLESLEIILERYDGPTLTPEQKLDLAARKNELYCRRLADMTPADLSPEVRDTLDTLRSKGLKLAIGSSSRNAKLILNRIGLAGFFDAVSDGTNITRSKPDPEVFVKAAAMLKECPEHCLVVEDAVSGAQAGHTGGFPVACVGAASQTAAGDYNLENITQLLTLIEINE